MRLVLTGLLALAALAQPAPTPRFEAATMQPQRIARRVAERLLGAR